ncbi:Hypothetical predicted protein [Mytilus galloprovincialis]|uniref:Uncharacterized protein n=1 Tax=Mytilus galloprovincialis TaxID=29158 RepID=A0A8B6BTF7_MYTGA|nr:Hypothetical predicted protein [Mytilus galloprovincialis]
MPEKHRIVYAMIDDQSSHTLATSNLFNTFQDHGPDINYSLISCAGKVQASGRQGTRYSVQSLDGSYNKALALKRANSLDMKLRRNPTKLEHVKLFMDKIFERGHAEKAPSLLPNDKRWYLPMFGVYHPRKQESIRVVFDSSAQFGGVALNDVLMSGPDLSNSLQGVLLRFRRERVAVTADVEQMFHNFRVKTDHLNYLRFLWHPNSDVSKPLGEFRMTVQVFGNSPSPAVATYVLQNDRERLPRDAIIKDETIDNKALNTEG